MHPANTTLCSPFKDSQDSQNPMYESDEFEESCEICESFPQPYLRANPSCFLPITNNQTMPTHQKLTTDNCKRTTPCAKLLRCRRTTDNSGGRRQYGSWRSQLRRSPSQPLTLTFATCLLPSLPPTTPTAIVQFANLLHILHFSRFPHPLTLFHRRGGLNAARVLPLTLITHFFTEYPVLSTLYLLLTRHSLLITRHFF